MKVIHFCFIVLFIACLPNKTQAQKITEEIYDSVQAQVHFTVIRNDISKEIELWPEVNFIKINGENDMVRRLPQLCKKGEGKTSFTYNIPKGSSRIRIELLRSNENRTAFYGIDTKRIN